MGDTDTALQERTFTAEQRRELSRKGLALPDGCLSGDTLVITELGSFPIRDLVGAVRLLTDKGWRTAEVRSFGVAPLRAVTLQRGDVRLTVHATGNHRWPLADGRWTHTDLLVAGDLVPHVADVPKNEINIKRVQSAKHSVARHAQQSAYSSSDVAVIDVEVSPRDSSLAGARRNGNFAAEVASSSLGLFHALEVIIRNPILTQKRTTPAALPSGIVFGNPQFTLPGPLRDAESALRSISAFIPQIEVGMGAYFSTDSTRDRPNVADELPRDLAGVCGAVPPHAGVVQTAHPCALGEPSTIGNRAIHDKESYPIVTGWSILSVTATERIEEVFCAVVPELHRFTLDGGILTGNSFPIENAGDLSNAIKLAGNSKNKRRAKRHILKRARALGKMDMIPDTWDVKEAVQLTDQLAMIRAEFTDYMMDREGRDYWYGEVFIFPEYVVYRQEGHYYRCDITRDGESMDFSDPVEVEIEFAAPSSTTTAVAEAVVAVTPIVESVRLDPTTFGERHTLLLEASDEGKTWDVILIQAGRSINGTYYPPETLKEAVNLFEGAYAFADHQTSFEGVQRPERSVHDKVGRFYGAEFGTWKIKESDVTGIRAKFKVIQPWMRDLLLESVRSDEPDFVGFSISGAGVKKPGIMDGKPCKIVEKIKSISSVDVVTDPAAGGRLVRLIASNRGEGDDEMGDTPAASSLIEQISALPKDELRKVLGLDDEAAALKQEIAELKESQQRTVQAHRIDALVAQFPTLSDFSKAKIKNSFADLSQRRAWDDDEFLTEAKSYVEYEARFTPANPAPGAASARPTGQIGDDEAVRMDKAMLGMFLNEPVDGVQPFRSLKEAYCRWEGKDFYEVGVYDVMDAITDWGGGRRYSSVRDHGKLRESITRATFANLFADNFYIMLQREYAADPSLAIWQDVVTEIEDVPDFQTRHWGVVGSYSDLGPVSEGQTYPMLVSPGDQEVTYSVSKNGGLDDVTFEAVVSDRFGKLRLIPREMARAAARTLLKTIMSLVTTTNPVMAYDSVALYDAAHGNTGTTALSISGWSATRQIMRDQSPFGVTDEKLGPRNIPDRIIVPNELESLANRIFNPSPQYAAAIADPGASVVLDPSQFAGKVKVIVYDYLTDATDWYAMANPKLVPVMVVGFLEGRRAPELFVQDDPTVGSNFTADKQTFKVRHIYGAVMLDHRSVYRQVVAG